MKHEEYIEFMGETLDTKILKLAEDASLAYLVGTEPPYGPSDLVNMYIIAYKAALTTKVDEDKKGP